LIENPDAFYITFDNKEVGRMQAREVFKVKPEGNYVFIKGSSSDPNADFLFRSDGSAEGSHRRRQDQERRRSLYRRLEAGKRPEEHGAVPDRQRQQGRRRRRLERRHGRWCNRRFRHRALPEPFRFPARTATMPR
jgi:hypothetical protein